MAGQGHFDQSPDDASVAAIVVAYNRVELLRRWLHTLAEQNRPVQEIIVVDNDSRDGTEGLMDQEFPEVTYIRMPENVGPGAAWAAGMEAAYQHGHDWFWVFGDDAFPESTALQRMLDYDDAWSDQIGLIDPVADCGSHKLYGVFWRGRAVHGFSPPSTESWFVDAVTFSGPLISRRVADSIGYPRSDFFFMFEEYEYCLRARQAGYRIVVLPEVTVNELNVGSQGTSPPWRGYYQSRNHLVMALERRSPLELFWWAVMQSKYCLGAMVHLDCKRQRVGLRFLGAWDGLRGRLGKTIDPDTVSRNGGSSNPTEDVLQQISEQPDQDITSDSLHRRQG